MAPWHSSLYGLAEAELFFFSSFRLYCSSYTSFFYVFGTIYEEHS